VTGSALVITYHSVDRTPGPLSISTPTLRDHLDTVADAGATTLTVAGLAAGLRNGSLPERAVVLTFDDAFASVVDQAAPLIAERGQDATVFAVAGWIGATNGWPSQPPGAPRVRLADLAGLRALIDAGWEVGSHGSDHSPLSRADAAAARRELIDSRAALEQALQVEVSSFALPYGDVPGPPVRALVRDVYRAACTTRLGYASPGTDLWAIPRIDAHYLRRPEMLRRAIDGSAARYLRARGLAARARRVVRKDFIDGTA
jgi:peptidoglycan/xylan/chitin deacetylase (PgdA/CDA1 family)